MSGVPPPMQAMGVPTAAAGVPAPVGAASAPAVPVPAGTPLGAPSLQQGGPVGVVAAAGGGVKRSHSDMEASGAFLPGGAGGMPPSAQMPVQQQQQPLISAPHVGAPAQQTPPLASQLQQPPALQAPGGGAVTGVRTVHPPTKKPNLGATPPTATATAQQPPQQPMQAQPISQQQPPAQAPGVSAAPPVSQFQSSPPVYTEMARNQPPPQPQAPGQAPTVQHPAPTVGAAPPAPTPGAPNPAPAPQQTAPPAAPQPSMPKVQDALGYLEKVKTRFAAQPVVYNQFLDIMKDFKSQNIDTEGVIKRVKQLFKGNRSLILGFNQFLPPGYKIELEPERRPTIEFKQAMEYVAKIKNRFREEPHIYAEFLDILHDYQAKRTIDEVYLRVQKLFYGQPDLLDEFKYFLPESAVQNRGAAPAPGTAPGAKTTAQAPAGQANRKPAPASTVRPGAGGAGAQKQSARGIFPSALDKTKQLYDAKGRPISAKPSTTAGAASSSDKNKNANARPQAGGAASKDAARAGKAPLPGQGGASKVSRDTGREGSAHGAHREHRHHHHGGHAGGVVAPRVTYPPGSEKELALFERMKAHSTKAQWIQFLKALNLFANDLITRGELIRMVDDIYGERSGHGGGLHGPASDWVEKFKTTIGYDETEEKQVAAMNQTNYYAFVSSVDFTVCHQVTPSYRELPQLIQVPHASGRTALADEVLNDTVVSIPTGSEDFSFKSTRKNIYEENLFKIEDERFELDMLIENNTAAIRVLEPLVEQIAAMPPEQAKRVRLPDTIDILHIRAIARVYAEQGYEMIELLNKAPTIATPVILARLRQKDIEWRKIRNEMKSTWRKVNEQNYQRSLDHRSFYFKQEDKKRRSPKALVIELKEVHQAVFGPSGAAVVKVEPIATRGAPGEKKALPIFGSEDITGEESLMLRAIRQGQPPNPLYNYCMRFKYEDPAVHAQLFDLVAKVARLLYPTSETEQVKLLAFFATFVAHFFGHAVTDVQEARLVAMQERVQAEEERRAANQREEEDAESKQASDALLGGANDAGNATGTDASTTAPTTTATAGDDEEARDPMEDDSDEAKPAAAPVAAPAATATATSASSRSNKGKKKAGKKKAATKKKPAPVAAAAAAAAAKPVLMHASKDEDDEDDDELGLGAGGDKLKGDDAGGDESSARRSQAAAQAASQLAAVRALMAKLRAAQDLQADGTHPQGALRSIKLHLDAPWMAEEAKVSAAAPAASGSSSTAAPTLRKHGRPSRLFLGSQPYYVFFRLHQFAYERLLTAKTLAHKARRNSSKRKLPSTPEERHARFAAILDQLLAGDLETSKFEDECRNLLGASSYVLFTIDKLIEQLVKQTAQLLASDNGLKVLALYQYENRRVRTCLAQAKKTHPQATTLPADQLSALARQYQSNISNLLGDESACAIEFFDDSHELALGLIEHLDASNRHVAGDEWNQFVAEYLSEIPPVAVRAPFRKRTVRLAARALTRLVNGANQATPAPTGGKGKRGAAAAAAAAANVPPSEAQLLTAAQAHAYQKSSLASKLDLRSFKLHFVENTTDVFVRAQGKTRPPATQVQKHKEVEKKKVHKFHHWLAKRVSELAPLAAAANAAGALGSMLGFGASSGNASGTDAQASGVDEDAEDGVDGGAMDTGADGPAGAGAGDESVFGALSAAADAEEDAEDDAAVDEDVDM